MAGDAELDRLKVSQDAAIARQQSAWQEQDRAWKRRGAAREEADRAYATKQRAYEHQQAAWEEYQRVRSRNGPRIDSLNAQQESAFSRMKQAFDDASRAHDARDGASARRYADDGHAYKAESQLAVQERRQLVAEIREARDRHAVTKEPFQRAKAEFDRVKAEHARVKAEHERSQERLRRAKANTETAKAAFHVRLAGVRSTRDRRRAGKRAVAARAGVPAYYHDNVYVATEADGTVNIYFGGMGSPEGPGHGHYVMDSSGCVTYQRDPLDPHGTQNFTDNRRDSAKSLWHPRGAEPPNVGVIAGTDHIVSFKTGGPSGEDTLIADGDRSEDKEGFDKRHNHYGPKREGGGHFSDDRGHYTGPDH